MTEKFIFAMLVLIYTTGCAASVFEIHEQRNGPYATELRAQFPRANVLVIILMVALWPLMVTWWKVREAWR